MAIYYLKGEKLSVEYCPDRLTLTATSGINRWETCGPEPFVRSRTAGTVSFADAKCESSAYETGTVSGVKAVYSGFGGGALENFKVVTFVYIERADDTLHAEFFAKGNLEADVEVVCWPAPFKYDAEEGYTVLPKMQGLILPAKWDGKVPCYQGWQMLSRDYYMPFAGQIRGREGYMMLFDTPWDACCEAKHVPGGDTTLIPYWKPTLGHFLARDRRRLVYSFYEDADYNTFAKVYRRYVKEHGRLVTMKQKIENNPSLAYLPGCPIYHDGIATFIHEQSEAYNKENPEANTWVTPFSTIGKRLENIRKLGFEKTYLHLDGWGRRGYDRLHPDLFPPCEEAGGAEGMKDLSDLCRELGFRFGIHDQFRDYYFEAESFDLDNVAVDFDGNYPVYNVWCGGPQTFMCPELCPQYVRRNYKHFEELGIKIDGTYLDVFSVVDLDECFNEKHAVTRKDCVEFRRNCFDYLNAAGIITSSEEGVDAVLPSIALVHHAPLSVDELSSDHGTAVGIPVPLFALVYSDCLTVPWFGVGSRGGWHIPVTDSGYLYALLTGGTVYIGPGMSPEGVALAKTALEHNARVYDKELVKHEFLGSPRRQRSTFADGTVVTVDFDTNEFSITPGN